MPDSWDILLGISGWAAWLSKEIISKLLTRGLARTGPLGVIEGQSRIVCDTEAKDGGVITLDYFPEMTKYPQYSDCRRFRLEINCQLYNDTDTQVVYAKPDLEFWGVEGLRLFSHHPSMFLMTQPGGTWEEADTIAVPAHSVSGARFEVPIGATFKTTEAEIQDIYGETVVMLRAKSISGKAVSFRLCTRSFAGLQRVVWPSDKKYPIFNIYSLNKDGRRAGRRPQERKPNTSASLAKTGDGTAA